MMKSYLLYILLLSTVCCISCQDNGVAETHPDTVVIPVKFKSKNKSGKIRMSDIFESVTYVHLDEADGEALIGNIGDIRITEAGIFVSDAITNTVLLFNHTGKFIRRYNHRGRGHGEYVTMTGFDVCEQSGNLSIYDGATRRMCVYSGDDEFLYDIRIDDIPRDFAVLDNGDYVFYTPDYMKHVRRGIWQTDSLGNFRRQVMAFDDEFKFNSGIHERYFHHLGDQVHTVASENHNDLYRIAADTAFAAYRLDVDIKIPRAVKRNPIANMDNHIGSVYTICDYLETATWMKVSVSDLQSLIMIFYNKTTGECHYIQTDDDIELDMPNVGVMMTSTEDAIIGQLSAPYIMAFQSLRDNFPSITEDSNPVLSICRTK